MIFPNVKLSTINNCLDFSKRYSSKHKEPSTLTSCPRQLDKHNAVSMDQIFTRRSSEPVITYRPERSNVATGNISQKNVTQSCPNSNKVLTMKTHSYQLKIILITIIITRPIQSYIKRQTISQRDAFCSKLGFYTTLVADGMTLHYNDDDNT